MYSNQQYADIERFPYIEAKDYSDINSIAEAFPQLSQINQGMNWDDERIS